MNTNDELKAVVETTLKAQILKAFNDAPQAINKLVLAAIEAPVDRHTGQRSSYIANPVPYLDYVVGDEIRRVAERVVREVLTAKEDEIRAVITAKLSTSDMIDAFVKKVLSVTTEDWRIKVVFGGDQQR